MKTTDVVNILNELIETCKDGEYGFYQSGKNARSHELRNIFRMRGAECQLAAQELKGLVRDLGGDPDKRGTLAGALHRGWVSVRHTINGENDLDILNECERGEDMAKAHYARALAQDLPSDIRGILSRQYDSVLSNHAEIKALRDRYRNRTGTRTV